VKGSASQWARLGAGVLTQEIRDTVLTEHRQLNAIWQVGRQRHNPMTRGYSAAPYLAFAMLDASGRLAGKMKPDHDGTSDADGDGFTNLEEYLNSLTPTKD
jgi:hypothetical protein